MAAAADLSATLIPVLMGYLTFALLLSFAWEILQAPLYAGMAGLPHAQVTKACLQATVGDMVIMLLAYGAVAVFARRRRWVVAASGWQLAWFVAIGVAITTGIEWLATRDTGSKAGTTCLRCHWCLAPASALRRCCSGCCCHC